MMGQHRFILGYKKSNTLVNMLIMEEIMHVWRQKIYGKSCTELTIWLYTHNYSKKNCFQKKERLKLSKFGGTEYKSTDSRK